MVSIQNLTMHFTGEDLFSNISFLIKEKDRIGLVGKNGAGKTTLLRLICKLELPHKGEIVLPDEVSIGYLPQEKALGSKTTVLLESLTAFDEIRAMELRINKINEQLNVRTDFESESYHRLLENLTLLTERLSLFGAHSMEGEAERILVGLGFEHSDMHRNMNEFSNGWQMRVELAKILLKNPSLLLLDEPTNHLDIESIQWLENFLQTYYGAVMLVSHDRAFLDNVTKRTIEISQGKVFDYKGSYSDYLEKRTMRIDSQTSAYQNQQREIKEIERFIERFRYKSSKAKQVQSRVKLLDKMDEIVIEDLDKHGIYFRFPPAPHSGKITVEAKGLSKSYGSLDVIKNFDLLITRGDSIAFVGRNGEGKTTLAKILAGELDYTGQLRLGHQVSVGYYAQNQHDMLDLEKTVFQTLDDVAVGDVRTKLKAILGAFMFSGDAVDKKVKVLSGGEKARLSLARMLLFPTNLLILDEPTNHLDMQSKDILKTALLQFDGTLIIVSHDRDFLQGLTNKVFEFKKPVIEEFIGDIYDFLRDRDLERLQELEVEEKQKKVQGVETDQSLSKINWEKRKQIEKEKRKIEREIERVEGQIEMNEDQLNKMDLVLTNPSGFNEAVSDSDWYKTYDKFKVDLTKYMENWETLHQQLEKITTELIDYQ
ncbi:MAG: glycosyl transferase family 2 [Bacteroidetes bacterium HGW-Bacteroidetes-1]|jgi:ATP-binding cassette subfamily F protein 3|nr:MAG: glycosyl transferase family 2 [Bacteroidetes bacterium HGW-Bacteroidetes-1]